MAGKYSLTLQLNLQSPANVGQVVSQLQKQLGGVSVNVQVKNSKQAVQQVQQLTNATNSAKTAAEKMGDAFGVSLKRFAAFSLASRAIGVFTRYLSNAVDESIAFDRQLNRIKQVTRASEGALGDLSKEITRLAKTFGVASSEITETALILAQAGLSANDTKIALEALTKTRLSATFGDINETAEGAVALIAQFGEGAGALERQLSAVNKVSAQFAVESQDLIEVIRRTGGVFRASGGNLEELLGLFTSVRATTREGAESIATALKTIFTRIQRPQTIEYLRELGVELVNAEGNFIGPYEAIKRLSTAFGGLEQGSLKFIEIAEQLGGYRQIGKVIPLLQQFAVAERARQAALAGGQSLTEEAAIAQESLAVQFQKVREEFLALIRSTTQTSTFKILTKTVLSLATSLIRVADALKPVLPLLTAFAAIKLTANIGSFFGGIGASLQRRQFGGPIRKFASGGLVPGSGNRDTVPAMLTPGEFVIRKSSVKKMGAGRLAAMNQNRYAKGGIVSLGGKASKTELLTAKNEPLGLQNDKYNYKKVAPEMVQIPIEEYAKEAGKGKGWEKWLNKNYFKGRAKWFKDKTSFPVDFVYSGVLYDAKDKREPKDSIEKEQAKKSLNYSLRKKFGEKYNFTGAGKNVIKNVKEKSRFLDSFITKGSDSFNLPEVTFLYPKILYTDKSGKEKFSFSKGQKERKKFLASKKFFGGAIQKFVRGGKAKAVTRNLGYIDSDVLADPANALIVQAEMEKLGIKNIPDYKMYLSDLAAKSRKSGDISKYRAIAAVAGAGKSSLMLGGQNAAQADNATLRKTNRFPILTPADISKATEIVDTTATVTKDKLETWLKSADRVFALSTTTKEEREEVKRRRGIRDATGKNLFGRSAGTTASAPTDSGEMEAMLGAEIDPKKLAFLGIRKDQPLKRKRGDQLIEVIKKKIGLFYGSFSPTTVGHQSMMDAAMASGIAPEDFLVLVGSNEALNTQDPHSFRTAVFEQDFRAILAKAGFGKRGAMISKKSARDFAIPKAMEIEKSETGRRRFVVPQAGSTAMVAGKDDKAAKKYTDAGYNVKDVPRDESNISGTLAREAILGGNTAEMQRLLSPEVFDVVQKNLKQLRNRAEVLPRIIEKVRKKEVASLADIEAMLAKLPARIEKKRVAIDPEYAKQAEQVEELRKRRDKIKSNASWKPFDIIGKLAARYPQKYGFQAFATGGIVPGSGNRDTVPAMLTPGEFVIRKSSVNKLGAGTLAAMNENRYKVGGIVNESTVGSAVLKSGDDTTGNIKLNIANLIDKEEINSGDPLRRKLVTGNPESSPAEAYSVGRFPQVPVGDPNSIYSEVQKLAGLTSLEKEWDYIAQRVGAEQRKTFDSILDTAAPDYIKNAAAKFGDSIGLPLDTSKIKTADNYKLPAAAKGYFFEDLIDAFNTESTLFGDRGNRPFDFTNGINFQGKLFDKLKMKYVDARTGTINDQEFQTKASGQLALELEAPLRKLLEQKKAQSTKPPEGPKKDSQSESVDFAKLRSILTATYKKGVKVAQAQKLLGDKYSGSNMEAAGYVFNPRTGQWDLKPQPLQPQGYAKGGIIQKFSKGNLVERAKNDSILLSLLQSYPSTLPISKMLEIQGVGNYLENIESAYKVPANSKLIGSGEESAVFDIGKRILKISPTSAFNLPRMRGVASYFKVGKFGPLNAALQQKLTTGKDANITQEDVEKAQQKLRNQGTEENYNVWMDPKEENLGRDKKGRIKITDGPVRQPLYQILRNNPIKFAAGGAAPSDTVPALLTPGEFVVSRPAAQRIGYGNLNRMNKKGVAGFAKGGPVGIQKFAKGGGVSGGGFDSKVIVFTSAVSSAAAVLSQFSDSTTEAGKKFQLISQTALTMVASFGLVFGGMSSLGNKLKEFGEKNFGRLNNLEKQNEDDRNKAEQQKAQAQQDLKKVSRVEYKGQQLNQSGIEKAKNLVGAQLASNQKKIKNLKDQEKRSSGPPIYGGGTDPDKLKVKIKELLITQGKLSQKYQQLNNVYAKNSELINKVKSAEERLNEVRKRGATIAKGQASFSAGLGKMAAGISQVTGVVGAVTGAIFAASTAVSAWYQSIADATKIQKEEAIKNIKTTEDVAKAQALLTKQRDAEKTAEAVSNIGGGIAAGVGGGALAGAAVGSVVPVLGTALGAVVGGIIGGIGGGIYGSNQTNESKFNEETNRQRADIALQGTQTISERAFKDIENKSARFAGSAGIANFVTTLSDANKVAIAASKASGVTADQRIAAEERVTQNILQGANVIGQRAKTEEEARAIIEKMAIESGFTGEKLEELKKQAGGAAAAAVALRNAQQELVRITIENTRLSSAFNSATLAVDNFMNSLQTGSVGLVNTIATLEAAANNVNMGPEGEKAISQIEQAALNQVRITSSDSSQNTGFSEIIKNQAGRARAGLALNANLASALQGVSGSLVAGDSGNQNAVKEALLAAIPDDVDDSDTKSKLEALISSQVDSLDLTSGTIPVDELMKNLSGQIKASFIDPLSETGKALAQQQQRLVELTRTRIEAENRLIEAQKSALDLQLESQKTIAEFGGKKVTPADEFAIRARQFDVGGRSAGLGGIGAGSAGDIRRVSGEIRSRFAAQQTELGGGGQGGGAAELDKDQRDRLKKANQDLIALTRQRIEQTKQELEIIKQKNALEKSSIEKLLSGDIEGFMQDQAASSAAQALRTGNTDMLGMFSAQTLGQAAKSLEGQLSPEEFASALGPVLSRFGIQDSRSAQVFAGATQEERTLMQRGQEEAGLLSELGQNEVGFAQMELKSAEMNIQTAKVTFQQAINEAQARDQKAQDALKQKQQTAVENKPLKELEISLAAAKKDEEEARAEEGKLGERGIRREAERERQASSYNPFDYFGFNAPAQATIEAQQKEESDAAVRARKAEAERVRVEEELRKEREKLGQAQTKARGGMIYANRGIFVPRGTDRVPAMLTPGEFVVRREAVQSGNNLQVLQAMNRGGGAGGVLSNGVQALAGGGTVQNITNNNNNVNVEQFSAAVNKLQEAISQIPREFFHQFNGSTNMSVTGLAGLTDVMKNIASDAVSQMASKMKTDTTGNVQINNSVLG